MGKERLPISLELCGLGCKLCSEGLLLKYVIKDDYILVICGQTPVCFIYQSHVHKYTRAFFPEELA